MATVYLADDLKHERKVALKVLKPELAAVVGAERFLAEIKTTANLQHPHILPLHDSGEAEGFLYYVMPYVEGDTLRDKIDREKQLPVEEALRITSDLAEALDHAHRHGVVHRDIKPANVLLSDGRPLIADFGIALAVAQAGGGRVTETGLSVGTPHYMSPEQATGDRDVDPRADVYALGCVLYEMLTGDPPYQGTTAQAVLGQIITGDPVWASKKRGSVPANVDAAIRKALEKLPADRFTGAQEFARALSDQGFRHGEGVAAGIAVGAGLWNRLTVGFASLAAVFALTTGWALLRPAPPAPVERFRLDLEVPASPTNFAVLPDGSGVVYVGQGQIMLRRWGALDPVQIPGTEGARVRGSVSVSPSGTEVVFVTAGQQLKVAPLAGGVVRTLAERVSCCGRWGPDGFIYYSPIQTRNIRRVPATGGADEVVTERGEEAFHGFFQVLPDGEVAVFSTTIPPFRVEAMRMSTGERKVLTEGTRTYYTSTGHLVFVSPDGQLLAATFDPDAMELTGAAVPLVQGVSLLGSIARYSLSANGTLVYIEDVTGAAAEQQLVVVDLEGNVEPLDLSPRDIGLVAWSPDGQSVVYSSEGQIYTYNVTLGTTPRQITFEGTNRRPIFSPHGSRVAFQSSRGGTDAFDLFVKDLNDDSPPRSIITLAWNQWPTQWPSDTLIVFVWGESGVRDLWMVNLSDPDSARAKAYLSSEADLRFISVSPDGTLAAYTSDESGQYEIYVRSFPDPGERTRVSESGGGIPFWSPDGIPSITVGGKAQAARSGLPESNEIRCPSCYLPIRCSG